MRYKADKLLVYLIIAIIALTGVYMTVVRCGIKIGENYRRQIQQNLVDVTLQNAENLTRQMDTKYDLLKSMALRFEMEPDKREENVDMYVPVSETFGLKRMGYVDKNGVAYATDSKGANLSYREFYIKGMNGETYISDVLEDAMDEAHEKVIIMSMPIHNRTGKVDGVACITYDIGDFAEDVSVKTFEGSGDTIYLNAEGHIVATSDIAFATLLDDFRRPVNDNGTMVLNGTEYLYQIVSVDLMDGETRWDVLSLVPSSYMNARFTEVRHQLFRMMMLILATMIIGIVVARLLYRKQRNLTYDLAYKSPVTDGPNLPAFLQAFENTKKTSGSLVYMYIENYAHIGIAAGVEKSRYLLKLIWEIIRDELRAGERGCHENEDEFVFLLKEANDESLNKRLSALHDKIHDRAHDEGIHWVLPKFGVYNMTEGEDIKDSYEKARFATTRIQGDGSFCAFYDEDDKEKQMFISSLERRFEAALEKGEFEIYYQPKYSTADEVLLGCEALVRWKLSDGTMVQPSMFIPMLEENGEIWRLDEYVFRFVCKLQAKWRENGFKTVPVSINLSRSSLYRKGIVDKFLNIITECKIEPSDVQIEVTESAVGGSGNIANLLSRFREAGVKILMDDFGTGYSSLATLNMQCFDTIKIDKSLVDNLADPYGQTLMASVVRMGKALGLYITAEGVETKQQLEFLRNMDCDDIQGFYYSRPLPCSDFERWLA